MKKYILTTLLSFSIFFAFAQNPLATIDSIGIHDCDSSQVFFYNLTPPQSPGLYYQWVINNDIYNVGTSQAALEVWLANDIGNNIVLNAFSDATYTVELYTKTYVLTMNLCNPFYNVDVFINQVNMLNCTTAEFALDATPYGGTPPFTYIWNVYLSGSNGPTVYYGQNQYVVLDNGSLVESIVIDADNQTISNYSNLILVNDLNANADLNHTVVNANCNTTTIQFFGFSQEPLATYEWVFQSGNDTYTAFTQNPIIDFDNSNIDVVAHLTIIYPGGCQSTGVEVFLLNSTPINAYVDVENTSTNPCASNQCTYEATLFWPNGIAPFTYTLNNTIQSTALFSNLCEGSYTGIVEDATGCMAYVNFQIIDSSAISFSEFSYFGSCDSTNTGQSTFIGIQTDSLNTVTWSDGTIGAVYQNPAPGNYNYIITSPFGCSVSGTFLVPSTNCYTISGNIYVDLDGDCIFNNNDYFLSNVWVDLADANGDWLWMYDYTDVNGSYSITAPAGTYYFDINGFNMYGFTPNCPSVGFSVTIDANNPNAVVDFYITPPAPVQDLSVSIYNFTTFTPGFPYWPFITYCNDGTIPMSGSVVMNYDANLTYIAGSSSSVSAHDPVNHTLTWNFTNLAPGACRSMYPDFTTSASAVLGSTMSNTVVVNPIPGDATPANNMAYSMDTVVGSWDPNDKAVYPNGNIDPEVKDHNYSIRFQNEGTAPAVLVVVRDDLDNNLDIQTLRNVSSSHNFVLTIENTDELVFTFNNIMLPAKQDDEPGSQGSINFSISQKENLPLGTVINNTAEIYFDFNEPIITNTTENVIVKKSTGISNLSLAQTINVFPNPNNGLINIISESTNNIHQVVVYDILGAKVFEANGLNTSKAFLNVQNLIDGVYFVKIETAKGNVVEKLSISKK